MLARLGIRAGTSLVGIAAGLLLSTAVLDKFSLNATAVIEAVLVFWVVHVVVAFVALKVLVREPSLALAGLLALGSTIVSLIIVNVVVSGLYISGLQTYVLATAIVWLTTAISDTIGRRMIRTRRRER
jgi:CDP-diglyceride synthetase